MNDADKAFMVKMLVVISQVLVAAVVGSLRLVRFALAPEVGPEVGRFARVTALVAFLCLMAGALAEFLESGHAAEVIGHLTTAAIIVHAVGTVVLMLIDMRKRGQF